MSVHESSPMPPRPLQAPNRWRTVVTTAAAAVGAVAALTPAVPTPAAAQSGAAPPFTDVVDVQLVNVEVWVADAAGRPVHGLTADFFKLFEDGEPVPISHFSEIRGGRPVTSLRSRAAAPEGDPAAGAEAAQPATETESPGDTGHLILYFDQIHMSQPSRKRLVEDLEGFLHTTALAPGRVLILRQGKDLFTEAPFGSTRAQLDAALSRLARSPTVLGAGPDLETRVVLQRLQELWLDAQASSNFQDPCSVFTRRAVPEVEMFARQSRARVALTLAHLSATVSFLAGVPGVKTLVYAGDALALNPGAELQAFLNDQCPIAGRAPGVTVGGQPTNSAQFSLGEDLGESFRRFTRHANANRVTLYSLQTAGLRSDFLLSADQAAVPFRGGSRSFEQQRRFVSREGMALIAGETGGRAIFNHNRFGDDLEHIADEMASYYSLAYEPPHGGDRGEHRIEVRVEGPGSLEIRHRRGYRDKGPEERMAERLQSALYVGEVSNPLGLRLGAGTVRPSRTSRGEHTLPLHVLVPADRVVFLPQEGKPVAQLNVLVAVGNTENPPKSLKKKVFVVEKLPKLEGMFLDLPIDLEMHEGRHVVAVGLSDGATRETSYISTTVEIGAPDGS